MAEINVVNKKASFDYFIEETYEAGIALQGWEFKSLLKNKANIESSYVVVRGGELFLLGATIVPLETACSHEECEPMRTRKLLMHRKEINKLIGLVERKGYSLIPLRLVRRRKIKLAFGLCKGKKNYDKREAIKKRDVEIELSRIVKNRT